MSSTPENPASDPVQAAEDKENLFIRNLVIALCLAALGAFVSVTAVITILIATNFNILEWME